MIEKISFCLVDESGNFIEIPKSTNGKIESKLEETLADLYTAICFENNNIKDDEIRVAEKFHFANALQIYSRRKKQQCEVNHQ